MSMSSPIAVATRLHLGNAKAPPSNDDLNTKVQGFLEFCRNINGIPLIAVDATPNKMNYDLVEAVRAACQQDSESNNNLETEACPTSFEHPAQVIPVTPWGKFVPALNALIGQACCCGQQQETTNTKVNQILFVSAETTASPSNIAKLRQLVANDNNVLVAGALLPGHDYSKNETVVPLNGRTTPWNTLAVWNLQKLALTGFSMVSEGYNNIGSSTTTTNDESYAGVEEVVAIAMLQKLLGDDQAQALLVDLGGVEWNQTFEGDPERQKWHQSKMKSKVERPQKQLELLGGLSGVVKHC